MKKVIAVALVVLSTNSFASNPTLDEVCQMWGDMAESTYNIQKQGRPLNSTVDYLKGSPKSNKEGFITLVRLIYALRHESVEEAYDFGYAFCVITLTELPE